MGAAVLLSSMRGYETGTDLVVYPFVYLLRHSLELALKEVLRMSRTLLEGEPADFDDGHNLQWLWAAARPLLHEIWPGDDHSEIDRTIEQLARIDPVGEAFRYPVSTKKTGRTPTLDTKLRHLDLDDLYRDVNKAINMIEGAYDGIHFHLENREEAREIDREMRAEMAEDARQTSSDD